jgi:hypothetical protein
MADKNIQKALYGPSYFEVALGAILGILVGIVAAVLYFVFKPVEKVTQLPKETVPNVVYFIPGKESATRAKGWAVKQKAFLEGGEVLLKDEELNAWGATLSDWKPADPKSPPKPGTPPPKAGAPAKPAAPANPGEPVVEEKEVFFAVGAPNFSIRENRLQIALLCHLNYYGVGADVWVKATGRFTRTGDSYSFTPAEFYFGSCPLHLFPAAANYVTTILLAELKLTDGMKLAWSKVSLATIDGEQLKIITKP